MLNWLFLSFVALHVAVTLTDAANEDGYIQCTKNNKGIDYLPAICDCTGAQVKCMIRFNITRNEDVIEPNLEYSINGGRIGPTIIVNYNAIVVVDVFNEISAKDEPGDVSIHWHGMHQRNVPFMDGVGMITQEPIKKNKSFRYVFRAKPSGTHWYHSHMRDQRDKGIFGALIVNDDRTPGDFDDVVDLPDKNMIAIQDHERSDNKRPSKTMCEPDASKIPVTDEYVDAWRINGVKLNLNITNVDDLQPLFYVEPGKRYRFRIIGAMKANVLRMSIDRHKLHVMSSDGYLTTTFETDLLMIHIGERYDFILSAHTGEHYAPGKVFPIRIESVAVRCNRFDKPALVGYAYLKYTADISKPDENSELVDHYEDVHRCKTETCKALNCPFENYPAGFHGAYIECSPVSVLNLLYPTPKHEFPQNENVKEYFFNFDFPAVPGIQTKAMVNGVEFLLPTKIPFVNPQQTTPNEKCHYKCMDDWFTEPQIYLCKTCSQAVRIPPKVENTGDKFKAQTIRFVLSSLPSKDEINQVTDVRTHPIHLHGHSFFVRKIAYPTYNETDGTILEVNQDLNREDCGPLNWKKHQRQGRLRPDILRKDVIVVPAGGYVVIEFPANNPGWWFMHCHIDFHLMNGMAIAVNELPECQNRPPSPTEFKPNMPYDTAVKLFKKYEKNDTCKITSSISKLQKRDNLAQEPDEINLHNLRQKTIDPVVNKNHDYDFASPYYKRLLQQRFRALDTDTEQRKFQDDRKRDEQAPQWDGRNEQIEESIQRGRSEEYM